MHKTFSLYVHVRSVSRSKSRTSVCGNYKSKSRLWDAVVTPKIGFILHSLCCSEVCLEVGLLFTNTTCWKVGLWDIIVSLNLKVKILLSLLTFALFHSFTEISKLIWLLAVYPFCYCCIAWCWKLYSPNFWANILVFLWHCIMSLPSIVLFLSVLYTAGMKSVQYRHFTSNVSTLQGFFLKQKPNNLINFSFSGFKKNLLKCRF